MRKDFLSFLRGTISLYLFRNLDKFFRLRKNLELGIFISSSINIFEATKLFYAQSKKVEKALWIVVSVKLGSWKTRRNLGMLPCQVSRLRIWSRNFHWFFGGYFCTNGYLKCSIQESSKRTMYNGVNVSGRKTTKNLCSHTSFLAENLLLQLLMFSLIRSEKDKKKLY